MTLPWITRAEVLAAVAESFGMTVADLTSRSRTMSRVQARGVYYYLSRALTRCSYADIGETVNRHYSSVMHGRELCAERRIRETELDALIDRLRRKLLWAGTE